MSYDILCRKGTLFMFSLACADTNTETDAYQSSDTLFERNSLKQKFILSILDEAIKLKDIELKEQDRMNSTRRPPG